MALTQTVYLGLGGNIGDRASAIELALARLDESGAARILRRSSLYETEPMELRDQSWFLNLVVEAETNLAPVELLARILSVEREIGRVRGGIRNGPRKIDIDILFYGDQVISSDQLEVPHPRMAERRFVLEPLAELVPDLRHPATNRTARQMLETLQGQEVVKLTERA